MPWWRSAAYRYPWRGMSRWGRRRWRPTADSATLAHYIHKKRARQRAARIFRNMGFMSAIGPPVIASEMVPPFIITGTQGPFEVPGPLQVYTSSTYFEAPTVVNSQEAWNIIRSRTEYFPLWWDRMR